MLRCAVLGDTESVKGFGAVGLEVFPCDDPAKAGPIFRRLASAGETAGEGYGVIYLTEELALVLDKDIRALEEQLLPAVIPIPGVKGNTGLGVRRLKESVEKAVGSDIIFND